MRRWSFNPRPALTRGATRCIVSEMRNALFQSAPRAHARGDLLQTSAALRANSFQSAPRAHARGDSWNFSTTEFAFLFQSAPRAHARGDCGPANRQRRKPLLPHLREHSDSSRVRSDSIVKERCKSSDFIAVSAEREIPAFESALGVRATLRLIADFKSKMRKVTESAVRSNRSVWRRRGVRSVSRPFHRGNRSGASLRPS